MTSEGTLHIRLSDSPDKLARITSTRPVHASRLFEGKTTAETLALIPRLFSVCGHAQTVAFARAAESASSMPSDPEVEKHRQTLVDLETLGEHLWRVLLDWPPLLGKTAQPGLPARLNTVLRTLLNNLADGSKLGKSGAVTSAATARNLATYWPTLTEGIETAVFGRTSAAWQQIGTRDTLEHWCLTTNTLAAQLLAQVTDHNWQDLGRCPVTPLPDLPTTSLDRALSGDGARSFIAEPTWDGVCHETSAFTRQLQQPLIQDLRQAFGNGLLPRLVARLVEISSLLTSIPRQFEIPGTARTSSSGSGLARIEAARGRLVHRVKLIDNTISEYAILAPTEWNFHPAGLAAQALAAARHTDRRSRELQARLLVNAIDPCVAFELRFDDDPVPGQRGHA